MPEKRGEGERSNKLREESSNGDRATSSSLGEHLIFSDDETNSDELRFGLEFGVGVGVRVSGVGRGYVADGSKGKTWGDSQISGGGGGRLGRVGGGGVMAVGVCMVSVMFMLAVAWVVDPAAMTSPDWEGRQRKMRELT